MLTYKLTCACQRPAMYVGLTVYANTKDDAFKIAEAYLLTQGYGSVTVSPSYGFGGAAPAGAKVGIKPRQPTDFATPKGKAAAAEYLKGLDFWELELRVLSYCHGKLGDLYADMASTAGCTREQMKEAVYNHFYTPTGRTLYSQTCRADPPSQPEEPREFPRETQVQRADFKDGRGFINLYRRCDGYVQAGNVYTTREGANAAAKNPAENTVACITWDPSFKARTARTPPALLTGLEPADLAHLENRLRAWAGMPDACAKVSVYAAQRYGYLNVTVGSPQWRECLDAFRKWLDKNNVPHGHRKGTTTVIEIKWGDLAPLVWPL